MTTATMLPVTEKMDAAGYEAIDLIGSVQFDVCVRNLWQMGYEAEIDDRIVENGSRTIVLKPDPPEPALPKLRKQYPNATDEDRA